MHFAPEPKLDPNEKDKAETRRFGFGAIRRTTAGLADEDLANAAWLHRLGQNELAAGPSEDPLATPSYGWSSGILQD
jgi:hypothetical protein